MSDMGQERLAFPSGKRTLLVRSTPAAATRTLANRESRLHVAAAADWEDARRAFHPRINI